MKKKKINLAKSPVIFDEEQHRYFLGDKELHGITSTLIRRAFPNKYDGISKDVLENAAKKGKELHSNIQYWDTFVLPYTNSEESFEGFEDGRIKGYARIKEENGLTTIANEYTVSDEQNYASQIDIVFENMLGEICLADVKTTWNLDKASTGLQLSIYKRLFEMQNPELPVKHIYAIWLPNKDHSMAEIHELSFVDDDTIDNLIDADLNDKPFSFEVIPDNWSSLERQFMFWEKKRLEAEDNIKSVKDNMMLTMKNCNLSSVKTGETTVSYIPQKTSKRFDSATFKKENSELYNSYQKEVETPAQIRILQKDKNTN